MTALISFARGAPSLDIVDTAGLRKAADEAFTGDPAGTFSYGTSVGYVPLREWIAAKHGVEPERVLVTNGSMQADAFLFDLLVEPGDVVVTEAPTYDRTLLALRQRGADIRMIGLQDDGIDVDALAELLESGVRPKLAHIIPNFQNPAGCTLAESKRVRLLELAAEHHFTIFEDDPYVELRFEGDTAATMVSRHGDAEVVYASSFSKTVCPGIRVGYLVGPPHVISAIQATATNTYISPNMVAQSIVNSFCRSGGLERSIETVKRALHERRDALTAALDEHLPDARYVAPQGGYFLWLELGAGVDVDALSVAARDAGVVFVKGTDFLLEGGEHSLRLAYSGVTPDQITEGVQRLAGALRGL